MYLHYYDFTPNVPNKRRKLNAEFVDRMKRICGGKHHAHVDVDINDNGRDMAHVTFGADNDAIKHDVLALCHNYGYGNDHVSVVTDGDTNNCTIYVSLNKPI
jgi:hypothetical protein